MHENSDDGGGGGIRTHEGLRPAGFQDRSHQPLDHPSEISMSVNLAFAREGTRLDLRKAGIRPARMLTPEPEAAFANLSANLFRRFRSVRGGSGLGKQPLRDGAG